MVIVLDILTSAENSRMKSLFAVWRKLTADHRLHYLERVVEVQTSSIANLHQKLQTMSEKLEEAENLRVVNEHLTIKLSEVSAKQKSSPHDPNIQDVRALVRLYQADNERMRKDIQVFRGQVDTDQKLIQELKTQVHSTNVKYKSQSQG